MKLSEHTIFLLRENIKSTNKEPAEMHEERAYLTKAIADFEKAVADLAAAGVSPHANLFYISYANDVEFLGGAYVRAVSEQHALGVATALGINPGGEALVAAVPDDHLVYFPDECQNRLLSLAELTELGEKAEAAGATEMEMVRMGDLEAAGAFDEDPKDAEGKADA